MQPQWRWYPESTLDLRVPQAESDEEQHDKKLISGVVRAMLTDPVKDKLIQNLPSSCNNMCTHVGEIAKLNICLQEGFDLCELS